MNDTFRDLKARLRRLDDMISGGSGTVELAQALSQARRALRRGDRSREPTPALESLVKRAEALAPR
jgi:hypothetical protein